MWHDNDPGTEAEHLSDMSDEGEDTGTLPERAEETRQEMRRLYAKAKAARVGSKILCPACRREHTKNSYQSVFCCNRGRGNCKDSYWNSVDQVRSIQAGGARLW